MPDISIYMNSAIPYIANYSKARSTTDMSIYRKYAAKSEILSVYIQVNGNYL